MLQQPGTSPQKEMPIPQFFSESILQEKIGEECCLSNRLYNGNVTAFCEAMRPGKLCDWVMSNVHRRRWRRAMRKCKAKLTAFSWYAAAFYPDLPLHCLNHTLADVEA
jgi:hypothetical protein